MLGLLFGSGDGEEPCAYGGITRHWQELLVLWGSSRSNVSIRMSASSFPLDTNHQITTMGSFLSRPAPLVLVPPLRSGPQGVMETLGAVLSPGKDKLAQTPLHTHGEEKADLWEVYYLQRRAGTRCSPPTALPQPRCTPKPSPRSSPSPHPKLPAATFPNRFQPQAVHGFNFPKQTRAQCLPERGPAEPSCLRYLAQGVRLLPAASPGGGSKIQDGK